MLFIHCKFQLKDSKLEALYFCACVLCSCDLNPKLHTLTLFFWWECFLVLQSCCADSVVLCCAGKTVACATSTTLGHFLLCGNKAATPKQGCSRAPLSVCLSVTGESPALFLKSGRGFLTQLPLPFHKTVVSRSASFWDPETPSRLGDGLRPSSLWSLSALSSPLVGTKEQTSRRWLLLTSGELAD